MHILVNSKISDLFLPSVLVFVIFLALMAYDHKAIAASQSMQIKVMQKTNLTNINFSVNAGTNQSLQTLSAFRHQNIFSAASQNVTTNFKSLMDKANKEGKVRVIVRLNLPFSPEGILKNDAHRMNQQQSINHTQDSIERSLSHNNVYHVKRFKHVPFMAMQLDPTALRSLNSSRLISGIYEDRMLSPLDVNTIPLTGTSNAWNLGYTGKGQTIAILDSGVDGTHPFLTGKVVSEACYSTPLQAGDSSLCPNGQSSQTGSGSAVPCSSSITTCSHGTFVAGIAAGNDPSILPGFAKDAQIIAVQVYHKDTNSVDCGSSTPCIVAYDSDVLSGLEYVYGLRNSFNIDAVNLSLGGGGYTSTCDSSFPQYKSEFDTLQSVGIATIVSSGNNGFVNALSSPACVSSAISVGSTNDSDQVSSFTNSASFLSLLAPGESVTSSVPGGGTSVGSGTSFAAPAVTGAWAILKQKNPSASVSTILSALRTTGQSVTDSGNGLVFPRIKVDSALQSLTCSPSLSGDWTVPSSCILGSTSTPPANVIVQSGAVLTIPNGLRLNIDFTHYHLLVKSGGGVLIKSGGAIN